MIILPFFCRGDAKRTLILVIVQTQVEGRPPRQVEIRGEAEYFSIKLADVHFQNALRSETSFSGNLDARHWPWRNSGNK